MTVSFRLRRRATTVAGQPKGAHMLDNMLVGFVSDELFWDPKVDNLEIAVSADDGKVTLRGTVGSYREKLEARKATERVYGVKSVENKLEVKLMNGAAREDS